MKKLILIALLLGISFSSCEDFEGWNVDEKNPSEVSPGFLLTSSQLELFKNMTSTSVNINSFKLFAQYWNEATYTDETNYDIRGRDIGGNFSEELYMNVLVDLKEATDIINSEPAASAEEEALETAQLGVLELMSVCDC